MRFAVCARPDREPAMRAGAGATAYLRAAGHEVAAVSLDSRTLEDEVGNAEVACVFGGDGTMLRAARALAPLGVALLGVNLGRLGFLSGTTVDGFERTIVDVAAGRYETEDRTLLDARLWRGDEEAVHVLALNDVVVARGEFVRSIHLDVRIDGEPFTVYWSDGLIVATATGSTAYGFSVGGPLILPHSRAFMMVPIAPHLSFGNAVVLERDQMLSFGVLDEPARLSCDGQEEHALRVGDRIEVCRSATVARFVRTATMPPFLSLLRQKILKEGN
ncbi:MAG: NAD(+)/NADH kinase [Candidatus Limnocylindria bacterium]